MSYKVYLGCHSKVSKEDQEFYELKNKAAEYYRSNGVPEKIEDVLNEMIVHKPNDIYGYLVGHIYTLFKAIFFNYFIINFTLFYTKFALNMPVMM